MYLESIKTSWSKLSRDVRDTLRNNNLPEFGIRVACPNEVCTDFLFKNLGSFFTKANMDKYGKKVTFIVIKSQKKRTFQLFI